MQLEIWKMSEGLILAQDQVTRVSSRSSVWIDIVLIVVFFSAALFAICRSSLRR